LDETYARRENEMLAQGERGAKLLINQYDDHALHLKEHVHYQKGMDHQKLKFTDNSVFMKAEIAFGEHNAIHQQFVEEALQKQMAVAQAMQGAGGKNG